MKHGGSNEAQQERKNVGSSESLIWQKEVYSLKRSLDFQIKITKQFQNFQTTLKEL